MKTDNTYEYFQTYALKNEFIELVWDTSKETDEYIISFDVVSFYANVPIQTSLELFEDWILSYNIPNEEVQKYFKLKQICINQNVLLFNDKYYSHTYGTAMGNPISCFIANI